MSEPRALSTRALLAYAALGPPLAMAALPVYVNVPEFYGRGLQLPIAGLGLLFLLTRAFDALQDPFLGRWSDHMAARAPGGRTRMLMWSVPVVCLGQWLLFNPPAALGPSPALWLWLTVSLVLSYFGFSAATISYLALAADLDPRPHQRTRLAGAREGIGLIGVMVAAALPALLAQRLGTVSAYHWFSAGLVPALLVGGAITLIGGRRRLAELARDGVGGPALEGPPGAIVLPVADRAAGTGGDDRAISTSAKVSAGATGSSLRTLWAPLRVPDFRRLLLVFLLSGTASSIPTNLVLFYIRDVIGAPELSGQFLLAYFLAGALGMPVWVRLAARIGKVGAWAAAMLLTLVAFVWAFFLHTGDWKAYLAVCLAAGLAFGGDIALPPALLSDVVDRRASAGDGGQGGFLGIWTLVSKLNLALSAGLSLPLLGWLGYVPGTVSTPRTLLVLAATYALLPCALKATSLFLLMRYRGRFEPDVSTPRGASV